jgi:hypothetical protein
MCQAKMPRRSSFEGFFLGGEGFADTHEASQLDVFASTEFASQNGDNPLY